MSRYATDFSVDKPDDFVQFVTADFFEKEGFTRKHYKTGEVVWTKGMGVATAPQFYKVESQNGQVHLEAWMAAFALPGLPLGETGINGFWGWAVKEVMRGRVNKLIGLLRQDTPVPAAVGAGAAQAAASSGQPEMQPVPPVEPIPVEVHNPTDKATLSLVLGIISLVACFVPFFGSIAAVVCGCIAVSTGRVGKASTKRGMAQAGFVLGIIGICLGAVVFIVYIFLSVILVLMS